MGRWEAEKASQGKPEKGGAVLPLSQQTSSAKSGKDSSRIQNALKSGCSAWPSSTKKQQQRLLCACGMSCSLRHMSWYSMACMTAALTLRRRISGGGGGSFMETIISILPMLC